jgi:hypothetical protein
MNHDFAKIFFPVSIEDDPIDIYEQLLFDCKNHFITKPVIPTLFLKKIEQFEKQFSAALFLYPELHNHETKRNNLESLSLTSIWNIDYHSLQTFRAQTKQYLIQANTPQEITNLIFNWVEQEKQYIDLYATVFSDVSKNEVTVSKETDSMLITKLLKDTKTELSIAYLKKNQKELPELLQTELKRLFLLNKMQNK